MKTAEIISVGTELLMGQIADTNAQYLGKLFPELGIAHLRRQTVGDNLDRLTEAIKLALSRADVVVTIGGLGPTEDDITRDGIAAALGLPLELDEKIEERLRKMFAYRKFTWTTSQSRQALRPPGSRPMDNPHGTAPGLICAAEGKLVIALPGPRGEFEPMADGPLRACLSDLTEGEIVHSRLLRICGLGESVVEDRIRPLLASTNPTIAPYAKPGEVHLRITARAPDIETAAGLIGPVEAAIRAELGDAVFGVGESTLEAAVLELMRQSGLKLALAESLTGGGLGERITSVPGSSDVFVGGITSYSNEVKVRVLGVDRAALDAFGAVSPPVAEQMAVGAMRVLESDFAISLTGIAGPSGGSELKPVGLVYIGVMGKGLKAPVIEEHKFRGLRGEVRQRAGQFALILLRRILLERVG